MSAARRGREWWSRLPKEKRRALRAQQQRSSAAGMRGGPMPDQHTYNPDLACSGCGTDSTVGCLRGPR